MKKKKRYQTNRELLLDYGKDIAVLRKDLKELQNLVFNMGRKLQTLWDWYENTLTRHSKVDKLLKKLKSGCDT